MEGLNVWGVSGLTDPKVESERASERAADTTIMEGRGKKKKSGKAVEKGETGGILKRCELRREAARRKWNEITDRKKG